eukprot:6202867-Pleurochrysis_carterae.AAC.2
MTKFEMRVRYMRLGRGAQTRARTRCDAVLRQLQLRQRSRHGAPRQRPLRLKMRDAIDQRRVRSVAPA